MDAKYVNYYIDSTIGILHEYLNLNLQLKTQLRMADDLIKEKDATIISLQNNLQSNGVANEELERLRVNARTWEDNFHAMENKVSHMDTLLNQLNEMKSKMIQMSVDLEEKDQEIKQLTTKKKKRNLEIKPTDINTNINITTLAPENDF